MPAINLGETQRKVLKLMSDLEWWTITKMCNTFKSTEPEAAMARLYKRGLLEKRIGSGLPFHHEYRLSESGIDIAIQAGVIQ